MVASDGGSSDGTPKASAASAKVKKGKGKKSSGAGGLPRMTVSVSRRRRACYACRPHGDGGRCLPGWPVHLVVCVM
eukprot:12657-Eustigmatos_ZCMA.PRE.1